jgi:hypothetical protein
LKVVKRSALRKARSVPSFDAWRNSLTTTQPAFSQLSSRAEEQLARRGGKDLWSYGFARTINTNRPCSSGCLLAKAFECQPQIPATSCNTELLGSRTQEPFEPVLRFLFDL